MTPNGQILRGYKRGCSSPFPLSSSYSLSSPLILELKSSRSPSLANNSLRFLEARFREHRSTLPPKRFKIPHPNPLVDLVTLILLCLGACVHPKKLSTWCKASWVIRREPSCCGVPRHRVKASVVASRPPLVKNGACLCGWLRGEEGETFCGYLCGWWPLWRLTSPT
jgi:hypothetical protein